MRVEPGKPTIPFSSISLLLPLVPEPVASHPNSISFSSISPEVEVVEDDEEVEVKVKEGSKAAALLEKLQVALDGGEDAKSVLVSVSPARAH